MQRKDSYSLSVNFSSTFGAVDYAAESEKKWRAAGTGEEGEGGRGCRRERGRPGRAKKWRVA